MIELFNNYFLNMGKTIYLKSTLEAIDWSASITKIFLKTLQNSKENNHVRASFFKAAGCFVII